MMFALNIELQRAPRMIYVLVRSRVWDASSAFCSHDVSPESSDLHRYLINISQPYLRNISQPYPDLQDIELNELQAFRADYMKFRAGQAGRPGASVEAMGKKTESLWWNPWEIGKMIGKLSEIGVLPSGNHWFNGGKKW